MAKLSKDNHLILWTEDIEELKKRVGYFRKLSALIKDLLKVENPETHMILDSYNVFIDDEYDDIPRVNIDLPPNR